MIWIDVANGEIESAKKLIDLVKPKRPFEEYAFVLKETNCPDPFRVAALNVCRDIAMGKIK